ncbi:MAG: NAD(P)/FAD-dependent oxidoreductase [Nocardioidaceae bacterium]
MSDHPFVVVGAGLAASRAIETLREEGHRGRVVLVGAESHLPYERPPLSKGVLAGNDDPLSTRTHDQQWYDDNDVDVRLGVTATGLDTNAHEVTVSSGDTVAYSKLLITTGAVPRVLDVPGNDLPGVHYLRTVDDSRALRETLARGGRLVVIGAGWIGLESAAAGRAHDGEVTVVSPLAPLVTVVGDKISQVFAKLHEDNGVRLVIGPGIEAIEGSDRVAGVRTSEGELLPADAVVVGVGAAPATALAQSAGLAVDNGILVDSALRTADPDVYAVGDVANWQHPLFGRRIRVEHWANAYDGGPAAARSMLGQAVSYDVMPFFFSDQYDVGLEYAGNVAPGAEAQVVVRGDLDGREFMAFWLVDGRLAAGMHVNMWDTIDAVQDLIRSGVTLDPVRLADPGIDLADVPS